MPFPTTERETYDQNPLQEVICQLRFPTILEISSQIPDQFQNAVRHKYPLYRKVDPSVAELPSNVPKEIADLVSSLPLVRTTRIQEHRFLTEDEQSLISLNQDFLALSVKSYTSWPQFREEIRFAESVVRETYNPTFYSRIGLRYRNIIDRDNLGVSTVPWSKLFNTTLLGVQGAESFDVDVQETVSRTSIKLQDIEDGFIQIRHGLAKSPNSENQVYLIDTDLFCGRKTEIDDALKTLDNFNRVAGNFFRWCISDTLRTALGPRDI
ncbi:MAG: TIGR04255 family protein [SAR202 cluster bacterium]|nr:TIGR04255 family protein [SAR202 cluster bacterium]